MRGLTALIGPPGSGKSTWLTTNAPYDAAIINLDHLRGVVSPWRDIRDNTPATTAAAVSLARSLARRHLARGREVIWDATNAGALDRHALAALAREHHSPTTAVIFRTPLGVCQENNGVRSGAPGLHGFARRVPEGVVQAYWESIRADRRLFRGEWDDTVFVDYQDYQLRRR